MEIIFIGLSLLQSIAVSLGVGSSTLAIVNFFSAIADGVIDETERRMMGVVYVVLRVAMVLILLSTFGISTITYLEGSILAFSSYAGALWTYIAVLYINALLMTLHVVPSTIGPALQASSWYGLGILLALVPLGLTGFSFTQFLLAYLAIFLIALVLVNGIMAYLKQRRPE